MTSACHNCHGAPATQPDSPDNQVFQLDAQGHKSVETLSGILQPSPCHSQCSATAQWPEFLKEAHPDLQALPWWVRNNFEKTRIAHAKAEDQARLPFRLDIGRGRIRFQLLPETGNFSLPKDSELRFRPEAKISGQVEIRKNRIPLWDKTLVEFARTEFHYDYYPGYLLQPVSVMVGNFGGLHFLSVPDSLLHFLMVPFMAPKIPVGQDFPTLSQEREKGGLDPEDTFLVYPDLKKDALDLDLEGILGTISPRLLDKIGRHFHDKHDRLPQSYNVEKLLLDILDFVAEPAEPKKPPSPQMQKLLKLSNLRSGQLLEIHLDELKDFFVPGVIDLGASELNFKVSLTPERKWSFDLEDVDLNLDPMDYFQGEKAKRSGVQLHAGSLRSAESSDPAENALWPSGIHVTYDSDNQRTEIRTQLAVTLTGKVPGLGLVELTGRLSGQSELDLSSGSPQLVPEKTYFQVSDFGLKVGEAKTPLIQKLNFSISDIPPPFPDPQFNSIVENQPALHWSLSTDLKKHHLELKGAAAIPEGPDGHYDFQTFLESFLMEALGQLTTDHGKVFTGKMTYASLGGEGLPGSLHHQVQVDLGFQPDKKSAEQILLKNGKVDFERVVQSDSDEVFKLKVGAEEFSFQPVDLKHPKLALEVDHIRSGNGEQTFRIPAFSLSANPRGNRKGLFRGKMQVKQLGERPVELTIRWNDEEKRVQLANLNLGMAVQQVDFKPLLPLATRRTMNASIDTLGIDGTLFGNFNLDFPQDFPEHSSRIKGWGDLLLRGDHRGDIYFVDKRGRMTGPPLVRDTMWHWSRVYGVNLQRGYALGEFSLDTVLNPGAFLYFTGQPMESDPSAPKVYGVRGQELRPYEVSARMYHNNQPWNVTGFKNRIVDYLVTLCREDAECAPTLKGDG